MTTTKTTHSATCKRVFSRYDATCPRCQELANGATARQGWGAHRAEQDRRRVDAIRTHDVTACAKKNGFCTCFEW